MIKYDEDAKVLWQDKKHILGMPISFTEYRIIKKDEEYSKLICIQGFLTSRVEEINMYRIDDIGVRQSFADKLLNLGTITIYCKDASCNKLDIVKVSNPYKVCSMINSLIIEDRKRVGLKQSEIQV
jgi:hypothetical protein